MRRACFYLFLFVSICWTWCRCRWMLLFLPLGARGGVLLGVPKWMAWPSSAAWPGGHRAVVLAAEDVGADSKKVRSESFPEPLRGELQHLRAGTTVYTWTWTRWFLRKKSKGCMAKALPLNQHARFGTEGAEEQISGSLSPHWQLFIQPSRFTVECSSCALKLELICISCYSPELLCKVKFYL